MPAYRRIRRVARPVSDLMPRYQLLDLPSGPAPGGEQPVRLALGGCHASQLTRRRPRDDTVAQRLGELGKALQRFGHAKALFRPSRSVAEQSLDVLGEERPKRMPAVFQLTRRSSGKRGRPLPGMRTKILWQDASTVGQRTSRAFVGSTGGTSSTRFIREKTNGHASRTARRRSATTTGSVYVTSSSATSRGTAPRKRSFAYASTMVAAWASSTCGLRSSHWPVADLSCSRPYSMARATPTRAKEDRGATLDLQITNGRLLRCLSLEAQSAMGLADPGPPWRLQTWRWDPASHHMKILRTVPSQCGKGKEW